MQVEVHRFRPGDEVLAAQMMQRLPPSQGRTKPQPTIGELQQFLQQEANYLLAATVENTPVGFLTVSRMPTADEQTAIDYLVEIEVTTCAGSQAISTALIELLQRYWPAQRH